MIKIATLDDIPRMLELGRELHEESRFSAYPFNEEKTNKFFETVIDNGDNCVFLSVKNGEIVGGFIGGVAPHWSCDFVSAFDYTLFIHKSHRNGTTAIKLIIAYEDWAKSMGVDESTLGVSTGINTQATARFYESLGYQFTGPMLQRRIK